MQKQTERRQSLPRSVKNQDVNYRDNLVTPIKEMSALRVSTRNTPQASRSARKDRSQPNFDDSENNKENIPPCGQVKQQRTGKRLLYKSGEEEETCVTSISSRGEDERHAGPQCSSASSSNLPDSTLVSTRRLVIHIARVHPGFKIVQNTAISPEDEQANAMSDVSPSKRRKMSKVRKEKCFQSLEGIRNRLHTSDIPERMPCREQEATRIKQFLQSALAKGAPSSSMYISGVPGTGKTATVMAVIGDLQKKKKHFTFVSVNAMELVEPKQVFVNILAQIDPKKKRVSPSTARNHLNTLFSVHDSGRPTIVLLIDELDMLCTRKQEFIYDLFNWSSTDESGVHVIAIANTLDLPERLLSQRITSRLGNNRICFQPYDHSQIEKIITERIRGSNAIEESAVELAARKVAALSGDLRKALDILRRAVEIALDAHQETLTIDNVTAAIRESASSVRVELIKSLSTHQRILFKGAVGVTLRTGLEEFTFADLMREYRTLCTTLEGIVPLSSEYVYELVSVMASSHIVMFEPGYSVSCRKLRLGMSTQEAEFALKQIQDVNP